MTVVEALTERLDDETEELLRAVEGVSFILAEHPEMAVPWVLARALAYLERSRVSVEDAAKALRMADREEKKKK